MLFSRNLIGGVTLILPRGTYVIKERKKSNNDLPFFH